MQLCEGESSLLGTKNKCHLSQIINSMFFSCIIISLCSLLNFICLLLVFLPAHLYSYLLLSSQIFVSGAALPHYCCFPFSFSRVLPKELPSPILLWPRASWATQIMKGKTQFVFWTTSVMREEKKRRKGEDGREGEGGRGLLKSQFKEWLKSLHIQSGVWGPLLTNLFAVFFLRSKG